MSVIVGAGSSAGGAKDTGDLEAAADCTGGDGDSGVELQVSGSVLKSGGALEESRMLKWGKELGSALCSDGTLDG